ncbi:hypothetical protein BRAS3843_100029 [Bradyrhizobium sp. STM 3843]|uniref:lytic transglycosylase domain-containing protein n=1 Tax=Bradyrhizobium sp. STM 3843 TaxID=551947 RepID=UPI000240A3F4|nr:lytic transglycosylase domain-containing protein [Bradyrhizobium sp. STM 3843]CCE04135.1 hypothetical protein BRAS3843_100029 [Bradyrhizobium sp. STM 3843]
MLQPNSVVPDAGANPSVPPNFSPETPFSPQQDLIGRLQGQQEQQSTLTKPAPNHFALSGLASQIVGAESSGNANAKNPNSSASGLGQFIDGTWLAMLRRYHPEINGTPQELLALRANPELSREMTEAYARENATMLTRAGLPVTPGNLYLAHFAGPGGARAVLKADPATPVETLLRPDAIKANPFLVGMTADGLRNWAEKRVGRSTRQAKMPVEMFSQPLPPVYPLNVASQEALPSQPPSPDRYLRSRRVYP